MLAFHSDHFVLPLPPGHRFPMSKYSLLREAVEAEPDGVRLAPAPAATDGELALAHEPAWIDAVVGGTTSPAQQREIGFPWSLRMVERARRSVGATIAAARAALLQGEEAADVLECLDDGLMGGAALAGASLAFACFTDSAMSPGRALM